MMLLTFVGRLQLRMNTGVSALTVTSEGIGVATSGSPGLGASTMRGVDTLEGVAFLGDGVAGHRLDLSRLLGHRHHSDRSFAKSNPPKSSTSALRSRAVLARLREEPLSVLVEARLVQAMGFRVGRETRSPVLLDEPARLVRVDAEAPLGRLCGGRIHAAHGV